MAGSKRIDRDLLDLLVPPEVREDPRRRLLHRGIGKSLLAISGVVAILFLAYLLVRPHPTGIELLLFASGIVTPTLGALFIRVTGRIEAGLFLTNIAGIGIVAFWCAVTGGITSVALPWFLPNLFLLSTFGSRRMLLATASVLLAVLALLFLATHQGWLPPSLVPPSLTQEFNLLSMLSSVALVVVAAVAVTAEREKSKRHLREAKNAAEAANRAKSAFLASMSHELRTPLNAVLLSAEMLKEDQDPPLSPAQDHFVDQLIMGGELLLGLVDQVLHISAMEAGKITLAITELQLSDTLTSALGVILPLAKRRQIRVEFDLEALSDLRLRADATQLKSILINLLSNAVKYNRDRGQVFIHAWRTPEHQIRIEIRDTGHGIPDQLREAAFQPFNRLGAEGTPIEGTGLGLAIVSRLVEMMAGTLGFDSTPGEGSTFWVDLPAAGPATSDLPNPQPIRPTRPADVPAAAPAAVVTMDVLVVEDHPINQQFLRQALERRGHRVVVAANGLEALEALERSWEGAPRFDIILMDILMEVMDGLEATRRIRQKEAMTGGHIPIVAVTACALDQDRDACFEAGMDDYLTKPVNLKELTRILARFAPGPPRPPEA